MPAPWISALLGTLPNDRALLLAVAAPAEAAAVLRGLRPDLGTPAPPEIGEDRPFELAPRLHLVRTGVGKAAAAATVAALLARSTYGGVVNLGIAGALPAAGRPTPDLLTAVVADRHVFADEGVALPSTPENPEAFLPLADLGFAPDAAPGLAVPGHAPWVELLRRSIPGAGCGPIATVSVCSGRDALARAIAARTGCLAEAMEGAAAALAARRAGAPYAEIRVISNTTGDRPRQQWRIGPAMEKLGALAGG